MLQKLHKFFRQKILAYILSFHHVISTWYTYLVITTCIHVISTSDHVLTRMSFHYFVLLSRNFDLQLVYTRCLLAISYCHHVISTFDLVFSRCFLVISCCYHEISTYNHVYTRYFLLISYCLLEISTFDLVFTRRILVISCCYHEI